jgi:hypothetical protein
MKSGLTSLYLQYYKEFRQQEINELKSLLQNREIHHKVEDAVSEYRQGWYSRMEAVQQEKQDHDGKLLKSYFREILFEKFRAYLPYDFYDDQERFNYEIERILDRPLQEVKSNYYFNYGRANESAIYQRFFDHDEVENLKKNDLAKILAEYHALYRFIDEVDLLAIELDKQIEDEKRLVKENKFNDLTPIEVYHFFLQLIESSPDNKKPMLNKDQIIDLTNMICSCDFNSKLEADITGRSGQLTYFFYKFYKYCTTSWDIGGKEEKYFSVLIGCIKQFHNGTYRPNLKSFSRKPKVFEIDLPLKFNT